MMGPLEPCCTTCAPVYRNVADLARLWQANSKALSSGDTNIPGAIAAVLKIQPQEAEASLRKMPSKHDLT
jgi:hypothetical protein